jgi:hypothetical protein
MEFGVIPLVLGSPNFNSDFLPIPSAAINIAEYLPASLSAVSTSNSTSPASLSPDAKAGLARLAARLEYLGSEEGRSDYEDALAWKKDARWRDSPFGKVVGLGRQRWSAECRLAGLLRGQKWAEPSWRPKRGVIK